MKHTHFFLGANSAEGFYGLYEQLLDARLYDLIILKGGARLRQIDLYAPHGRGDGGARAGDRVHPLLGRPGFTRRGNFSRHRHRYCGRHRAPRYGYLRTPVCLFILLRLLQLHERIA